jgi:tetratricopeptide (TPR) repeat protein
VAGEELKPSTFISLADAMQAYSAGRYAEAEDIGCRIAAVRPNDPAVWNLLGVLARVTGRLPEAVACYRRGIASAPDFAALWSNLGNALKDLKRCEAAIVCHRRALELEPDVVTSLHNLGVALTAAGRDGEALKAYDAALAIEPANENVLWDRALSRLRLGDYAGGWQDYEARFGRDELPKRDLPGARWNGEPYAGKTLLVAAEQGLGDGIWVARYLRQAKALGGEMIVECREPSRALLASMGLADRIILQGEPLPAVDFHIPQCSLPGMFTPGEAAIPAEPYLAADPKTRARLAPIIAAAAGDRLKVGIVWGGSGTYASRADRDAKLAYFLAHFNIPGVQLFSLQKGPQEEDLKALPAAPVVHLTPHTADMFETAAAVAELDLVIMTDTSITHLAGALGKPVWVLLCRVPHWMWQYGRSDCAWYPSMRLFRQRTWGDWTGAFDEAAAALQMLVLQRSGKLPTV